MEQAPWFLGRSRGHASILIKPNVSEDFSPDAIHSCTHSLYVHFLKTICVFNFDLYPLISLPSHSHFPILNDISSIWSANYIHCHKDVDCFGKNLAMLTGSFACWREEGYCFFPVLMPTLAGGTCWISCMRSKYECDMWEGPWIPRTVPTCGGLAGHHHSRSPVTFPPTARDTKIRLWSPGGQIC